METNTEIWGRLRQVAAFGFEAVCREGAEWSGSGEGSVRVSEPAPNVLVFEEAGTWRLAGGKTLRFTNVFRWTLGEERLRLEHLRFGAEHAVFLFEMAADADRVWREVSPHLCREDSYQATLRLDEEAVLVNWTVRGPGRADAIDYVYR